jgi:hypothetical protein
MIVAGYGQRAVRLPEPVTFEAVKARKKPVMVTAAANQPQRTTAAGTPALSPAPLLVPPREKPHFLGEPKHNEILASLADVRL